MLQVRAHRHEGLPAVRRLVDTLREGLLAAAEQVDCPEAEVQEPGKATKVTNLAQMRPRM